MIDLAVEYYKDKNDADKKGAAFYVKGCILEEYCKDIPNALLAYKEAETCIPDMDDKHIFLQPPRRNRWIPPGNSR